MRNRSKLLILMVIILLSSHDIVATQYLYATKVSSSLDTFPTSLKSIAGNGSLDPWQIISSMIVPRAGLAVVASGGYIYALGGFDCNSPNCNFLSSVERAAVNPDGSLGTWELMPSLNTPRTGLAAVVANGFIYALGGYSGTGYEKSIERAVINTDGSLGPWQTVAMMNKPRSYFPAIVEGAYLYVLPGFNGESVFDVERAAINPDGSIGTWELMPSLNTPRTGLAAVVANGYIYALGGLVSGGCIFCDFYTTAVERSVINPDGSLGPWQNVSPLNTARQTLSAVSLDNYIYAIGGLADGALDIVELASIGVDNSLSPWQATTPLILKRNGAGAVVVNGFIYVIGGVGTAGTLSSVERSTTPDMIPPKIMCPPGFLASTELGNNSTNVVYPSPVVTDNRPGATVMCSPQSGSIFPLGTTTVTCTASDVPGNTATCSFTVRVANRCLQDDSNPNNVVQFNTVSGAYRFCCNATTFTGTGAITQQGSTFTIQHNAGDRRVTIRIDNATKRGTASLQSPPGTTRCSITDRNITNNTCNCQ